MDNLPYYKEPMYRAYRSGKAQKCLLCRQSEEMQKKITEMSKSKTIDEISKWLQANGIDASWTQVRYFLRKQNVVLRRVKIVPPKKTYPEKSEAVVKAILETDFGQFTIRTLGMRGTSWIQVLHRMNVGGILKKMTIHPRASWKLMVSREELQTWRDADIAEWKETHKARWDHDINQE